MLDLWGLDYISQHWVVITEDKPSSLFKIAKHYNFPVLDHPKAIGGRYSIFTNVGMSVAFLLGLDVKKIHEGARKYLKDHAIHLENSKSFLKTFDDDNKNLFVIMPYVDRLFAFSLWFRQLWAESIGKNGKGSTPITAQGTVDQHSQLQIYLDGPKDKVFTFLKVNEIERMEDVNNSLMPDYLKNKSISDLFKAEEMATIATLSKNNPVRVIEIDKLSEESLGALLMHFISETILMAEMLNLDPFDQPAVEEGKSLAREYLSNGVLSR